MIGEVVIWPAAWVPAGFLICDGRRVARATYPELFAAIGTRFGGDADHFALPDLRGRMVMGVAPGQPIGARGGAAKVALTVEEMPSHSHKVRFGAAGDRSDPARAYLAESWSTQGGGALLAAAAVTSEGRGEPHENMPPFLVTQVAIRARATDEEPGLGEIRLFAGVEAPAKYLPCDGRELDIDTNQALFSLLADHFPSTEHRMRLPDLQARFACGIDTSSQMSGRLKLGTMGGAARVKLDASTLGGHGHSLRAARAGSQGPAGGKVAAGGVAGSFAGRIGQRAEELLAPAGGGRDHENLPPYLVLSYVICVEGRFPAFS